MFKRINRRDVDPVSWDAFVESSDEAWLWHRYDFREAFDTWWDLEDRSFAVIDSDRKDAIVAVVPAHRTLQSFAKVLHRFLIDVHGGVACGNDLLPARKNDLLSFVQQCLWEIAAQDHASEIAFKLCPVAPAFLAQRPPISNPLRALGCQDQRSQVWLVDCLSPVDQMWNRLDGRMRTSVRKAKKNEVRVREADRPGDLDLGYALHVETYVRTHVRPHPRAYFEQIWEKFRDGGLAHILFAEISGKAVAMANISVFKQAAEYWTGASSQAGLSSGANALLQWTALERLHASGVRWYNCGYAFPSMVSGKLKGLNDFKKGFGGELYPAYYGSLSRGGGWQGSFFRVYSALRRWMSAS